MVTNEERVGYVIIGLEEVRTADRYESMGTLLPEGLAEKRADLTRRVATELEALAREYDPKSNEYYNAQRQRVGPLARQIHEIDQQGRIEKRQLPRRVGREERTYAIGQVLYQ